VHGRQILGVCVCVMGAAFYGSSIGMARRVEGTRSHNASTARRTKDTLLVLCNEHRANTLLDFCAGEADVVWSRDRDKSPADPHRIPG
jgi:hypothetical protein